MKITKILFLGLFLVVTLYACEDDEPYVKIGLEVNRVALDPKGDSIIVKTKGGYWGISTIYETVDTTITHGDFYYRDTISGNFESYQDTISINWFTIIKMDKDVFVKVAPNNMGKEREIRLVLMKGNFSDRLIVTQAKND